MGHYDTIIVGLGCAGVTAASTLANAGQKVLGLEAQDRIGGKVKTVPFGDGFVEEGAEWIHGTVNSRVYTAAVQNNIPLLPQEIVFQVFRSDGSVADEGILNELIDFCFEGVGKPPADYQGGLGDFVTSRLTDYIQDKHPHILNDKGFLTELLELVNLFVCNYESANDWNDVNVHSRYEQLEGHQHMSWHKYGYKTFFEVTLNTYNNGPGLPNLDIKLNTPVSQIIWPHKGNGDVKVVCGGGATYTARHVIVTVSLGVLKDSYTTLFSPGLPHDKITAIETLSIGVMDKIIFNFPHPWWPKQGWFYGFLWRSEDRARVAKEDYWVTRIFAASNPMGCTTALTLWTSGEVGKMLETFPEDLVKAKCMELLRKFMGKSCEIPEPTSMIRSTWHSNPYTRGSYSFDNRIADATARERLAASLCDAFGLPRVLFAGEATEVRHYSAAHGACDSGYREARKLLNNSKL